MHVDAEQQGQNSPRLAELCRWIERNRDRTHQDWLSCAGGLKETGTEQTEPKKGQAHRQNFPWAV